MAVNDNDSKTDRSREGFDQGRLIRFAISDPGVPVDEPPAPVFVYASPLELASLDELRLIVEGAIEQIFQRVKGESFEVPAVRIQDVLAQRFEETDGAA